LTHTPPYPEFPAIRAYIQSIGGHTGLAERHGIAPRTAQRIYSGNMVPNARLLAELLQAANA
jgi:hypothetical protein